MAAVDISDEAVRVLDRAREVARDHAARLSVVTVIKPLTHVYGGLDMLSYTQNGVGFEREAQAQLRKQAEEMAKKIDVQPDDVHVSIGAPANQIVDTAVAQCVDLIVVGSHGKHGLGLLLGSTSNGVLHQAKCDVLTVRMD
jgi:universal stress protein A